VERFISILTPFGSSNIGGYQIETHMCTFSPLGKPSGHIKISWITRLVHDIWEMLAAPPYLHLTCWRSAKWPPEPLEVKLLKVKDIP